MSDSEFAIQITDLSVVLGKQDILKNISLQIPTGRLVGLLGPSGAGKTTLARAIIGRQHISSGQIKVLGQPTGTASLRSHIGYMPQGTAIYPDLTVAENVEYFAKMGGHSEQAAREVIQAVELAAQTGQLARTLSGGQMSRVSLAIALLGQPKLLVLDEPTVGVDPVLRQQLWKLFEKLANDGCTLLVTSHVMDEASHCQELLLIRDGQLLAHGTPAELQDRTHTKDVEESFLKLVGDAK